MAKAAAKTVETSDKAKEYLAKKLKSDSSFLKSPTKRLLINTSMVNEKGEKAPQNIGTFHIVGSDLYSDNITFRPIAMYNKLMKVVQSKTLDGKEVWATVNETVFFSKYSETLYDKKGGIACGKVFGDAKLRLNKEQLDANNDKAKSFLFIFGLAKFPDSKDWFFVDLRLGGKRIMEASAVFNNKALPKGHVMSEFTFDMDLVPNNKGTIHPDIKITPDFLNILPVDDILEYDDLLDKYITESNNFIMSSHKKYVAQNNAIVEDNEEEVSIEIGDDE